MGTKLKRWRNIMYAIDCETVRPAFFLWSQACSISKGNLKTGKPYLWLRNELWEFLFLSYCACMVIFEAFIRKHLGKSSRLCAPWLLALFFRNQASCRRAWYYYSRVKDILEKTCEICEMKKPKRNEEINIWSTLIFLTEFVHHFFHAMNKKKHLQ